MNNNALILTALMTLSAAAFADDMIDPDLPIVEKKERRKTLEEKVPAFFHYAYAEGILRRWRDVPTDSFEPIPEEKRIEMSDRYIAECRKEAQVRFRSLDVWGKLGDALLYRDKFNEAEQAYRNALECSRSKDKKYTRIMYRIAECQLGRGETNACLSSLKMIIDAKVRGYGKTEHNYTSWAKMSYSYLSGASPDALGLPRYTGFKPFPEPQKAQYTENFTPCPEIAINLVGVDRNDARVKLILEKKLTSRGFKYSFAKKGAYTLTVALDPQARVAKNEGYSLDSTSSGTEIRARDRQGILWGIVSFIQILDPVGKRMRNCVVDDWPDCPHRGYLGSFWSDCTEFTVFNKMNSVTHQGHVLTGGTYTPLNMFQARSMAQEFKSLGLELYYGFVTYTMGMGWPYCWNSYCGMQIEAAKIIASLGANVYYPNDDARYAVITPEDEETGLKPSDYDAKHLLTFFNAVKKEYPDFKLQYCPPFYWGPNANHPYPDSREKYLKSLRILPEDVIITWTGERVCSFKKRPSSVQWYSNLIGRKPILFQNKTGPHRRLSYIVDHTDWYGWHYPGFFENDIYGYQKNSHTPMECPQITSLADCLWNPKGYDMERGIKRGLEQYVGKGIYDALRPALPYLSWFDRYRYGAINTLVRDEDPQEVDRAIAIIDEATEKAVKLVGAAKMNEMGAWMRARGWAKGIQKAVKNPPDFRKMHSRWLDQTLDAALSSGYEKAEGDLLFDAIDFHKVEAMLYPPPQQGTGRTIGSRLSAAIYPGETAIAKKTVNFLPLAGKCKAAIYGQGGCLALRITLNDKVIYEGRNHCNNGWNGPYSRYVFHFPSSVVKKGENVLKIKHTGSDYFPLRVNHLAIMMPKVKKSIEDELRPKTELDNLTLDE